MDATSLRFVISPTCQNFISAGFAAVRITAQPRGIYSKRVCREYETSNNVSRPAAILGISMLQNLSFMLIIFYFYYLFILTPGGI